MLSFFKKNNGSRSSALIVFFALMVVGVASVTMAAYTPPACPPPGCNTDAPITVGTSTQFKYGNLTITSPTATGTLISDLLWTNYGAVINADGGGASGVGLLVPRDKVGIGFSGIGTDLPQAKLDVNGGIISRGSLVVGTSTPSSATLDVNGTINSRGNMTIGSSTVGNGRRLDVYGDIVVSEVASGSTFGYVYKKYFSLTTSTLFTGTAPDLSWWIDRPNATGSSLFRRGTNLNQIRLDSSNTDNGCDDASLIDNECQADSYDTNDTKPVFTRLYDLWATSNQSNGQWTIHADLYAKVWTQREGGSITTQKLNASEGLFYSVDASIIDGYYGFFDNLNVSGTISAIDIYTRGRITAPQLCVSGGTCFTSSTLVGVWEKSTSTGSIFYDGGFVGIGTGSTPGSHLHIKGNASVVAQTIENTKSDGVSALAFSRKDSAGMLDEWGISGSGDGSNRGLFIKNGSRAVSSLSLLRNGNVGIGTQSPLGVFDVVGDGDVRLKPNSLSGRVIIGDNGLVNTVINGDLSLQGRGGGSYQYNFGGEVIATTTITRSTTITPALWPTIYTADRLSCDQNEKIEDLGCIEGNPHAGSVGGSSKKYDLYLKVSGPALFNCGIPPTGSSDPRCSWSLAARVYNMGTTSGGDLHARNGNFQGNLRVVNNMIIGTGKPGFLLPFAESNLDPYGLSVSGKVRIGSIVAPSGKSLDVMGGILVDEICLGAVSSTSCRSSWPTFTVPTSTPSIWQIHSSGTYFGDSSKYVGIGGAPISLPLTVYTNSPNTGWIQLKDPGNDWHITGFGGGFNITQTGVAKRLSINNLGQIEIYNTLKIFDPNDTSVRTTINPADFNVVRGSDFVSVTGFGNIVATKDIKANRILAGSICNADGTSCSTDTGAGSLSNGYQKFPNGFIIQWGLIDELPQNGTWKSISLPTSFSSTNYSVTLTGSDSVDSVVYDADRPTKNGFRAKAFAPYNGRHLNIQWIAVGY